MSLHAKVYHKARQHRFALAAFLIPLGIRAVPELIAGPYPIGYDTITSYVPIMHYWINGNLGPFNPAIGGWLLFALLGLTYQITRLDPLVIVKATGPLLYGTLGVALFRYARVAMSWTQKKSLLLVAISLAYFVTLRIGWDLFRNTLGISFLLLALSFGPEATCNRKSIAFAVLGWLTVAAHLLAGAIFLGITGLDVLRRSGIVRRRAILFALPAALQFALSLALLQSQGIALIDSGGTQQLLLPLVYPVYVFLPMSFLLALGILGFRDRRLLDWIVICGIGIVLTVIPLSASSHMVGSDRWTWMMSIPVAAVALEGFSRLPQRVRKPRLGNIVKYSWATVMILLAGAYLFAPASMALPYYDYLAPTSMLQSTVPAEQSSHLALTMQWLSSNIPKDAVLMVHNAFYGWAIEYFKASNHIVWFFSGTTLSEGLRSTLSQGYSVVYTVWWANGQGWYGEPTVPTGFALEHRDGPFGVFLFFGNGSGNP